jgi:hypothetical protein
VNRGFLATLVFSVIFTTPGLQELAHGASLNGTVVDAETGMALPNFKMVPGKQFLLREGPLRWDRDNSFAGSDGKFTFQFSEEDTRGDFGLAIEAAGYLPSPSPRYTIAGNYTYHFKLQKGNGIRGVAKGPDGKPLLGANVYLVDSTERVYMNEAGELEEPSSRNTSTAVTDAEGRFLFEPRLDPSAIILAHTLGYAEVRASDDVQLTLQPWGAVKGVLRVGPRVETNHFVGLYNMEYQYGERSRFWPPLYLRLVTRPNESGAFAFPKVPPGERRIYLQYSERDGPVPRSHGFAIGVKPGESTDVTLGGRGQRITGKVIAKRPIDWTQERHLARDFHLLVRKHPEEPSSRSSRVQRAFWTSETGRAFQRSPFEYVLIFQPDGSFHTDNVPPGDYSLTIRPTDREPDSLMLGKPLGEVRTNILVRDQPIDLGTLELKVK